jgi:hypothetical protein
MLARGFSFTPLEGLFDRNGHAFSTPSSVVIRTTLSMSPNVFGPD